MSQASLLTHYPNIINIADPQGLVRMAERYCLHMEVRNYSPRTINNTRRMLYRFIDWCCVRGLLRPTEITKPIIERYQRHLYFYRKKDGKPLTFSSQSNALMAIKQWFKWLTRENFLPFNPASEIDLPKRENRLPKAILSEKEAEKVLAQPDVTDVFGLRDRAILELLYATGMRRLEICQLSLFDIDTERETVLVNQGKGGKDRLLPLSARAIGWINRYLNDARPDISCGLDNGELFLSRLGTRINPDTITKWTSIYVKRSGISKVGSSHLFRHTLATTMLDNGAELRYVQAMLGHSSIEATKIYTHVSIKKLQAVYRQTHPSHAKPEQNHNNDPDIAAALAADLAAENEDD